MYTGLRPHALNKHIYALGNCLGKYTSVVNKVLLFSISNVNYFYAYSNAKVTCSELKEINGLIISIISHATSQHDDTIMMP